MRDASLCRISLQIIAIVALVIYGCSDKPVNYPQRLMPDGLAVDASMLSAGHDLFRDKCASCHGKSSEGRSDRAANIAWTLSVDR